MPVVAKAEGILFHLPFLAHAWASAAHMLDDQSSSLAFCSSGVDAGLRGPEGLFLQLTCHLGAGLLLRETRVELIT